MPNEEEKIGHIQVDYDDITTVEEENQCSKQPFQKSKAEKQLLRKINFTFLPLVACILMFQVTYRGINAHFCSLPINPS